MGLRNKEMDIVDQKIQESKMIKDELVRKYKGDLDEKLKSQSYKTEQLIIDSSLGGVYHDLIDSKDELQSKYQRKYNQAYHSVDVELYKVNQKIDRHVRSSTARVDRKVGDMEEKIKRELLY
ncbi:MAG: hypothetical protein LUG89_05050 [Methanosphaera sp.]|nr:hypothetical protein [Methanosphaera sp.]